MPGMLFFLFLVLAAGMMVLAHLSEKRRREEIAAFCREQGLAYDPEKDRSFDDRFGDFPGLRNGSNRYLRHRMMGQMDGHELLIGEYHYQTTSSDGKKTRTHHWYSTLVMFRPPFPLPDLSVRREGLFDRVASAFGWDDIDFSSAAFSQRYHVSAPNRNDAFALIQPPTMDLLMAQDDLELHIRHGWLMIRRKGALRVEWLPRMRDLGLGFLREIPEFVREGASA